MFLFCFHCINYHYIQKTLCCLLLLCYLPLKPDTSFSGRLLNCCSAEVKTWLSQYILYMYQNKNEALVIQFRQLIVPKLKSYFLTFYTSCKEYQCFFYSFLKIWLKDQISYYSLSGFCLLTTLETSFMFLLTYCNLLNVGLSKALILRLQLIQNAEWCMEAWS